MDEIEENILKTLYHNERTTLGKSVLKQAIEALGIKLDEKKE